jgi:hypothetical protein
LYVLKRLALQLACAGSLAMLAGADARAQSGWWGQPQQQEQTPPASRGENFSAGKSPAQLFVSDCTGSGCHKGPQGLGKDRNRIGLAGFLREHYTNSRETAAALAAYLVSVPGETRAARPERQPRAAARSDEAAKPGETAKPGEAAKPGEDAARTRKPAEESKPAASRTQRGRQATAAPPPAAAPTPAPEPPAPPPEPPKPQWDIFD